MRAKKKIAKDIENVIREIKPDRILTRWTKIMATAIIIQTITLITINILK